jgi:hypothetical protein
MAVVDGQSAPGVGTHIDADGAVIGATAALDAANRVRNDLPFGQRLMAGSKVGV